ncbi:MAG: exodeoxyribonuclease III [Alphaproteobacteria bacterium]|nr:exodeoxyribonuclease III [Alphaproteobacteria bacterium]
MKIVSWNVNSINARKDHVFRYLDENDPDVLMVQELKGLEFPADDFKDKGYETEAVCQKAYNGVAMISKHPISVIHTALPGDESDEQARYIEADIKGVRLINIYLPNGNPAPGDKYDYKLRWMERLHNRLKTLREQDIEFIIGGDFNVIPEDKDCHDPKAWIEDALFRLDTRKAYRKLLHLGLTEAFRVFDNRAEQYTFWDYQAGAWQRNNGIRIDHFLLSPVMADKLIDCQINKTPRGWDKASDHTPIEIIIDMIA